jgi:hypothetical protein
VQTLRKHCSEEWDPEMSLYAYIDSHLVTVLLADHV